MSDKNRDGCFLPCLLQDDQGQLRQELLGLGVEPHPHTSMDTEYQVRFGAIVCRAAWHFTVVYCKSND